MPHWIAKNVSKWQLKQHVNNPYPFTGDNSTGSLADFFVFEFFDELFFIQIGVLKSAIFLMIPDSRDGGSVSCKVQFVLHLLFTMSDAARTTL